MPISGIFILNTKGDTLITKFYRDDVTTFRGAAEVFRLKVVTSKDVRSPVLTVANTTFCHIKIGDLFVVAVTASNLNVAMAFEILYRFSNICYQYFGQKFTHTEIKANYSLVLEILEEIMDNGYPQTSDIDSLRALVLQKNKLGGKKIKEKDLHSRISQATGAIPWRREGIVYTKNELFIDVVESIDLLVSQDNEILNVAVAGQILMRTRLSGKPECIFGMNDTLTLNSEQGKAHREQSGAMPSGGVELDDVTFHQCVNLAKFESESTISFIPPDGAFELMRYRYTELVKKNLPFRIISNIREVGTTKVEVQITVKSTFDSKTEALNITIFVPTPDNTAICRCQVVQGPGKAKYKAEEGGIVWKMKRFPGCRQFVMRGVVELINTNNSDERRAWSRPPIRMTFNVPGFAASGLQTKFVKVIEKSGYHTTRWVRYLTKSGNYQIRM
mmetsp:Transcript_15597/g.17336  ORF Transcript_15597/g.17336 Transcript_15597/m.17336 type:complete len:445 (+) Transcript_15597:20-1354(+)